MIPTTEEALKNIMIVLNEAVKRGYFNDIQSVVTIGLSMEIVETACNKSERIEG